MLLQVLKRFIWPNNKIWLQLWSTPVGFEVLFRSFFLSSHSLAVVNSVMIQLFPVLVDIFWRMYILLCCKIHHRINNSRGDRGERERERGGREGERERGGGRESQPIPVIWYKPPAPSSDRAFFFFFITNSFLRPRGLRFTNTICTTYV